MLVLRTSHFRRSIYHTDSPETGKHSTVFIVHQEIFFRTKLTETGISNLQLTNLAFKAKD